MYNNIQRKKKLHRYIFRLDNQASINFCCDSHEALYCYNPEDVECDAEDDSQGDEKANQDSSSHWPFNVEFRPEVGRYIIIQ